VFVLDIYAASEVSLPGVTAEKLAQRIATSEGISATYAPSFQEAARAAVALAQPGEAILTLGAGSISQLGPQVVALLESQPASMVSSTPR
jgi:UDP-N-acetylmuramate--alanine ligase